MLSGVRAPSRATSSAAVSTAHAYGLAVLASSQRATNCGAAARVWVSPYPGCLQRHLQPRVTGGGGAGPFLLCGAELRADADDVGQVHHFPFPRVRIGAGGIGQHGIGGVQVGPQRADDHQRVWGVHQRPHHAAG